MISQMNISGIPSCGKRMVFDFSSMIIVDYINYNLSSDGVAHVQTFTNEPFFALS